MNKLAILIVSSFCIFTTPLAYGQKNLKPLLRAARKVPAPRITAAAPGSLTTASMAAASARMSNVLEAATQDLPSLPGIAPQVQERTSSLAHKINQEVAQSQALQQQLEQQKIAAFDAHAIESVGKILNPFLQDFVPLEGSVFFIEETYQGKTYLWGVTAAHMIDYIGPDMYLRIVSEDGLPFDCPITVVAKGNAGMADVAIFKPNEDLSDLVRPLTLAKQAPAENEILRSYGFFENDFHILHNRRVLASTPGRLVTSFEFGSVDRAGACGGPLLNNNNEVVGIHCGSSRTKQESYAVPVSFLSDLLEAAHHNGIHERDLVLNGKVVGKIGIDEYIYSVNLKKMGLTLHSWLPWHEEQKIDYAHLEKMFPLPKSGVLELVIVKGGPIQSGCGDPVSQRLVSIHLKSGDSVSEPL